MEQMKKKELLSRKRIAYIDFMNIWACFGVVCLHCSGYVFEYGQIETRLWMLSMLIQTIMHPAVPIFFMITGTTLLEYRKKYSTKVYFKKRFLRTGIPFVFWSVFYLYRSVFMEKTEMPGWEELRNAILNNQATGIFWFFYALFAIYLCIPVFSLLVEHGYKVVEYICILSFLAVAVYPVLTRFYFPIYEGIVPTFFTGYIGYVFWGWLIYRKEISRKMRKVIYFLGIAGAILLFAGTWCLSARGGAIDEFFMEYTSLACYPLSVAVMVFGRYANWDRLYSFIAPEKISKIAGAGLGIYLVHLFYIELSEKIGILAVHPMYYTIIMPFAIYLVSLITVLLLQKIPIIRKVLP